MEKLYKKTWRKIEEYDLRLKWESYNYKDGFKAKHLNSERGREMPSVNSSKEQYWNQIGYVTKHFHERKIRYRITKQTE